MKGRGASFDKNEPQADWVVRLINGKRQIGRFAEFLKTDEEVGPAPHLRPRKF